MTSAKSFVYSLSFTENRFTDQCLGAAKAKDTPKQVMYFGKLPRQSEPNSMLRLDKILCITTNNKDSYISKGKAFLSLN